MAAVLPFLETEEFHWPEDAGLDTPGLSGLGAAKTRTDKEILGASNSELTKLLWIRTLVQKELAKRTFRLVADPSESPGLSIQLSSPMPKDTVPWFGMSVNMQRIAVFSTNSKMRCPTFDLPAGSNFVAGTCPAAGPAQATSLGRGDPGGSLLTTIDGRRVLKLYPDVEYNAVRAVCGECYATGGLYGYTSVQVVEMAHLALMRAAISDPSIREAVIQAFLWEIPRLPYDRFQDGEGTVDEQGRIVAKKAGDTPPEEVHKRMREWRSIQHPNGYPRVVRVHSSGDFFDLDYCRLWVEIAQRLYATHGMDILLWAPTRTHVLPAFANYWKTANVPENFIIRPSAYHIGDAAPGAQGLASGTSVLTPNETKAARGEKYDHQCGVYGLKKETSKTCVEAPDPMSKPGCRACWVNPELRINYVAH